MKVYNKIMETFWLAMSIVLILVVIYMIIVDGWTKNGIYLVFPIISFTMWIARRFMRRRMEKHLKWMEENANKDQNS